MEKVSKYVQIEWAGIERTATDWTVRRSNSGGGLRFSAPFQTVPGYTQPPIKWVPGLFPEDKAVEIWR